jgi:hypothetical protein
MKEKEGKSNDYMRRSSSTYQRVRVQDMNMKELMDQERAEAIATLDKANSALSRIFNVEEGESE